jgi:integrase
MTRSRESGPRKYVHPQTEEVTWSFVVDVGVDADGKRKQARRRGFKTKKEATNALNALRSDVQKHVYVTPAKQRVGEYLDEWLSSVAGDLQASTLSSYKRVLRVHVRPRIGGKQLQHLDASALKKMYAELGETLSQRSVRYAHAILHHALKDAVEWGRITRNPADVARPPKAKESRARLMTTWDAAEVRRFFALGDVGSYPDRVAWWVAVNTGLRRGELLGLRWRDIDLEAGQFQVVQTVTAIDHKIVIGPGTKTGRGRSVSIDATTVAELRAHRVRQAQQQLMLGRRVNDSSLVFARPDGAPLDPDRFSERFIRMVERHPDLPRLRLHDYDLRHTHATMLLKAGVPLPVVSKRLGHASLAMTADVYMHVNAEMQSDAAERGAALIANAGLVTSL